MASYFNAYNPDDEASYQNVSQWVPINRDVRLLSESGQLQSVSPFFGVEVDQRFASPAPANAASSMPLSYDTPSSLPTPTAAPKTSGDTNGAQSGSASNIASQPAIQNRIFDANGRDQYGLFVDGNRDPIGGEIYKKYRAAGGEVPSGLELQAAPERRADRPDPAWMSSPYLKITTDPTTGYRDFVVDAVGKFPGYRFRQTGQQEYETTSASGGGEQWTPLQTRKNSGYRIDPESSGIAWAMQNAFDAANPKSSNGAYQSRLFDYSKPYSGDAVSVGDAYRQAQKWAQEFYGGTPTPVDVPEDQRWIFSGHQPVAQGMRVGYLADPTKPWDAGGNFVVTSLTNPNWMPQEMPDQYDLAAYTDWVSGRDVKRLGPSSPRPESFSGMNRYNAAWSPKDQRFVDASGLSLSQLYALQAASPV